jgi:deoxyribodipyrimidine photo-lyase
MQASFRRESNYSLCHAVEEANRRNLPLVVYAGAAEGSVSGVQESFYMTGLKEALQAVREFGAAGVEAKRASVEDLLLLGKKAALVVLDRVYCSHQEHLQRRLFSRLDCAMDVVDSNVIVPVTTASDKKEYMARTLRKKITAHGDEFCIPCTIPPLNVGAAPALRKKLPFIGRKPSDNCFDPGAGAQQARRCLDDFISRHLTSYHLDSNDPAKDSTSRLSPYLHFGQISPVEVYRAVMNAPVSADAKYAFTEQLFVRRELACNFVFYNPGHAHFEEALPSWALETLQVHAGDTRQYLYSRGQFEEAATHDPYWNAAQTEMLCTGFMHNYMRMYWGKKILEWSASPREGFETALYLQNTYALDGNDANTYAGVAWCFGTHDQGWKERPVFGKVRYMNAAGLERKFHMQTYLSRVNSL